MGRHSVYEGFGTRSCTVSHYIITVASLETQLLGQLPLKEDPNISRFCSHIPWIL